MLNPILNPFSGQSNAIHLFHTEGPTRPDGTLEQGRVWLYYIFLSFVSEKGKLMSAKKIRRANGPLWVPTPLRLRQRVSTNYMYVSRNRFGTSWMAWHLKMLPRFQHGLGHAGPCRSRARQPQVEQKGMGAPTISILRCAKRRKMVSDNNLELVRTAKSYFNRALT